MSYDDWKTTDPREPELPEGIDPCGACDALGYTEDEDGKHTCFVCKGERFVEVKPEPDYDSDEYRDLDSLLASAPVEDDSERPSDEMTADDIEEMFAWYAARGIHCYADRFASDSKGRC
jgi:hypothetical protein